MRPTKLTMTAFGPYRNTETIDFTKLKEYGLFAVAGATGAGKTTIFDAICFALYGQASGEDRKDIRALRSDFAQPHIQTAVELEFVIQDRTFRVFRQVPYIKQGNKSETNGRTEFFEMAAEGEVPGVDRQIVSEVNKKVEELIGFTLAQFSQIVMLPQGEFRKFLTSDTENKETILRKIFKTENYREMTDILKRKRDAALNELTSSRLSVEQTYRQIPASLPDRETALFDALRAESIHSVRVMEGLEEERLHYKAAAEENDSQYRSAYREHENAQQKYFEGTLLNTQFEELEGKTTVLNTLTSREGELNADRLRLRQAEQAVQLERSESRLIEATADVKKHHEDLQQTVKTYETAKEAAHKVEELFNEELQKQPIRQQSAERLITLQNFLPNVTEIEEKEQQIQEMKKQVSREEKALHDLKAKEQEKADNVHQLKEQIEILETESNGYEQVLDSLIEARNKTDLLARLSQHTETIQQLSTGLTYKQAEMEATRSRAADVESQWLADQAAILAETLQEGDPCPVCGSAHHPAIQLKDHESRLSREQVETEKQAAAHAYEGFRAVELQLANERNEAERLEQQLGKDWKLDDLTASHANVQELEEKQQRMKTSIERLPAIKQQFAAANEQLNEHRQAMGEKEKNGYQLQAELKQITAVLDESLKTVPEPYRSLQALRQEIKREEEKKSKLEQDWEHVNKQRQSAMEAVSNVQTTITYMTKALEDARAKQESAKTQFKTALSESIFQDEAEYKDSKLLAEQREALNRKINEYDVTLQTTKQAIAELEKQVAGKEKADLAALREHTEKFKQVYEHALSEYHSTSELEKNAADLHRQLEKLTTAQSGLEQKGARLTDLHNLIRGNNERKLSFERYLQTEYLERILHAANGRLGDLSNGQFQLLRSDRQESRGRQSGLGIDVYDEYTGQNRDVKTLSGGEKFNASLSLALGMADVIQSFQGSISVETMFIDEGFGSLDEESLQKAIDTLISLQKAGRMIGVISHVAELKEAFPAVLRVEKTKEGHSYTSIEIR